MNAYSDVQSYSTTFVHYSYQTVQCGFIVGSKFNHRTRVQFQMNFEPCVLSSTSPVFFPMRLLRPDRIYCDSVAAVKVGSQGTSLASLIQSWRLLRASGTVMNRAVTRRSVCTNPQCNKLGTVSSPKSLLCRILSPLETCMIRKPTISYQLMHTTLGSHCEQNKVSRL